MESIFVVREKNDLQNDVLNINFDIHLNLI